MDEKLTDFIGLTGCDPGLARDLLEGTDWDVRSAVTAYESLKSGGTPRRIGSGHDAPDCGASSPSRPRLQKGQTVDEYKEKRLKRGISRATDNTIIVTHARNLVINDLTECDEVKHNCLVETPEFTFILPDLTTHSSDFRAFLEKDLIETSTMVSLEQAGRLNWWADTGACQRLWPLATTGDGNCLLHAASLGMWGFHDRLLTLRKALHSTLTNGSIKSALYRRWRWQQMINNKEAGFAYSDADWEKEWSALLKLASAEPRSSEGRPSSCCDSPATRGSLQRAETDSNSEVYYESLEEFHVFVLAHVLQRPIVVVADKFLKNYEGEAIAPIPFGGIYLPYECSTAECHKSPLVLTYDASHFSSLVAMETSMPVTLPVMIPLVGPDFELLPLHFGVDPGTHFVWNRDEKDPKKISNLMLSKDDKLKLLRQFLNVECVPIPKVSSPDVDDDAESKSSNGSVESEEAGGKLLTTQISSDSGKSDKEKSKMAKQMQSVAKQFGSIGKSMGKKLKNMGKAVKKEGSKDGKGGKRNRKLSVGNVTQSTRVNLMELLEDREHILCAKLSSVRADYQHDMVKNYMASATLRFEQDRELKRQRSEEMKQRAVQTVSLGNIPEEGLKCANSFCKRDALENLNYLCTGCYDDQKQKAIQIKSRSPNLKRYSNYDNVPESLEFNPSSATAMSRNATLVAPGKSKFYTPSETNLSYYSDSTGGTLPLRKKDNVHHGHGVPLDLSHSTFYEPCQQSNQVRPLNNVDRDGVKMLLHNVHGEPRQPAVMPPINAGHSNNVSRVVVSNHRPPGVVVSSNRPPTVPMQVTRFVPCDRPHQVIRNQDVFPRMQQPPSRPLAVTHGHLRTGYGEFDQQMERALREQGYANPSNGPQNFVHRDREIWSAGDEMRRKCKSHGCKFYGSETTDFLCSDCFKGRQKTLAYIEATRQTKM